MFPPKLQSKEARVRDLFVASWMLSFEASPHCLPVWNKPLMNQIHRDVLTTYTQRSDATISESCAGCKSSKLLLNQLCMFCSLSAEEHLVTGCHMKLLEMFLLIFGRETK